jgi:hypothetical protein
MFKDDAGGSNREKINITHKKESDRRKKSFPEQSERLNCCTG